MFAEVNRVKAEARAKGDDIIDLGMGNPDSNAPDYVTKKLIETLNKPKTHGYSVSRGVKGLRQAQANYYKRRFNVDLDYDKEVIATIGSKEGLSSLAFAITGPDDYIIVPSPCYPIHTYGFILADSNVVRIPNNPHNDFIASFKKIVESSKKKPMAVVLNYPCNPTAEVVGLEFYEEMVRLCKGYGIYIISDLAYAEIYFDGNPPPSILQVEGAKDIAIEFTSLSKTFSMAGWRVGFAAGNPDLIAAMTQIKSYLDYGIFTPIQVAATAAINGPEKYIDEMRTLYKERRDILVEGLHEAGWNVTCPTASMFIWTEIPEQYKHLGSLEFSKLLLKEARVAVAPGVGFGEEGENYVRIALVENKHRIRQAVKNIKKFLQKNVN